LHHEDREEHEVQKYQVNKYFVTFVRFVVEAYFVVHRTLTMDAEANLRKRRGNF
jgi:hypothetical protein